MLTNSLGGYGKRINKEVVNLKSVLLHHNLDIVFMIILLLITCLVVTYWPEIKQRRQWKRNYFSKPQWDPEKVRRTDVVRNLKMVK